MTLVHVILRGDVSTDEARALSGFIAQLPVIPYRRYLVDLRTLGSIGPEGRKVFTAPCNDCPSRDNVTVDLGFIGATVRTKVLMTVVIAAAMLSTDITLRSLFFYSEEDATAWAGVRLSPLL